ncbi:MAG: putative glycoside hydrolase, partial [Frankia sp.]|nr:putative glycoside hydrolase [Frankia sp.]
ATLRVGGKPLRAPGGRFRVRFARPPAQVPLVATDPAGNATTRMLTVPVRHPGMRAIHVTAFAWATPSLRSGVVRLIREHRVDAIELDVKDESGIVGYDSHVPLARRVGAVRRIYDIRKAVAQLHAMHVRVVGRIVAFRDPVLATAAWRSGSRDQVIQAPNGSPYNSKYGGFTNFANPVVRRYNIDLAVEAARAGFDDILYDYIRRPDGPIATMRFPTLRGTPEHSIVTFTAESRARLRPLGTYVGVSVFGVAATRPHEVAQDIPQLARYADYIAPMLYPSHWAHGEYGVSDPNRQPFDIVARSLKDFLSDVRGTNAAVIPWLQDFSLGVSYGPVQVLEQIRAARSVGIPNFLLWDPSVTYTVDALKPTARR